jgi:integrase
MFGTADNRPLDEKVVNQLLKTLCESLEVWATKDDGIKRLPTAYELRHTMITHISDHPKSTIKGVSQVVGHSSERMVRDRYWHKDDRPPRTEADDYDWG